MKILVSDIFMACFILPVQYALLQPSLISLFVKIGSDGHDSMKTKSILDLLFLIRCSSTKYLRGEIKLSENFRVADKSKTCTGFDHLGRVLVMMMLMVVVIISLIMVIIDHEGCISENRTGTSWTRLGLTIKITEFFQLLSLICFWS